MVEPLQQLSLFGAKAPDGAEGGATCPIPGLGYHPDFVTPAEERGLIAALDRGVWTDDPNRRNQQFGYVYNFRSRLRAPPARYTGALPEWCMFVPRRIQAQGLFPQELDQMIAQEYQPGQGIGLHTDLENLQDDVVCILSLSSQVQMDFLQPERSERWARMLWPRSLLVISGVARYEWQHGISKRRSDPYRGERLPRQRRISLSFRHLGRDNYVSPP